MVSDETLGEGYLIPLWVGKEYALRKTPGSPRFDKIPQRIWEQRGGHARSRYRAHEDQVSDVRYTLLGSRTFWHRLPHSFRHHSSSAASVVLIAARQATTFPSASRNAMRGLPAPSTVSGAGTAAPLI